MARNGVQYQQVVQAIQTLQRQGENPTVQRIREMLGTGSFTTLSEHLRQWRYEQRSATPLQQESQAVPDTLLNLTRELWQAACAEADQKLQHYQQAADQEIRQALSDKQLAMEEALRTEEKNLLLERKNTELLRDIKQLTADTSRIQTLLEEKDKQLLALENSNQEREAAAAASIHKLQAQVQQQKEEHQSVLAHEQQRNEDNQLRWMQEVDLARQETRNLQEKLQLQLQEIKQERTQHQQALKTSQQQVQQQQLELQARQLREQEIKQQLETKEQQLKQLEAQALQQQASLKIQLEEKTREVENSLQEITRLKAAAVSHNRPAPLILI